MAIIFKVENLKLGFSDIVKKIWLLKVLYKSDYCILSNNAKSTYEKGKANVPKELLEEEEIKTLKNVCVTKLKHICSSAAEVLSHEEYMYLSKSVYVQLLIFTASKAGELGKLLLEDSREEQVEKEI